MHEHRVIKTVDTSPYAGLDNFAISRGWLEQLNLDLHYSGHQHSLTALNAQPNSSSCLAETLALVSWPARRPSSLALHVSATQAAAETQSRLGQMNAWRPHTRLGSKRQDTAQALAG